MNQRSCILTALMTFGVLPLILCAALPAFSQQDSADTLEGSAAGQADVPAGERPAFDASHVVTENGMVQPAPPDLQHQGSVPLGRTLEGRTDKDRVNRDKVKSTTKPIGKPMDHKRVP